MGRHAWLTMWAAWGTIRRWLTGPRWGQARVASHVTIGADADLGTRVNIIQKIRIGEWSVIGGAPGRVIKTRSAGWQLESGSQHL
jgi:hypothetical protein